MIGSGLGKVRVTLYLSSEVPWVVGAFYADGKRKSRIRTFFANRSHEILDLGPVLICRTEIIGPLGPSSFKPSFKKRGNVQGVSRNPANREATAPLFDRDELARLQEVEAGEAEKFCEREHDLRVATH